MKVGYCFFFKQKTAYEMRISDWSSDVCSSDLDDGHALAVVQGEPGPRRRAWRRLRANIRSVWRTLRADVVAGTSRPWRERRLLRLFRQIGRASGRERGCPYV